MNVTGDPVDERGDIKSAESWPIHRAAPEFSDQSTETEMLSQELRLLIYWLHIQEEEKLVYLVVQVLVKQLLLWS